jgi:lysophospholipase L1-like esterase
MLENRPDTALQWLDVRDERFDWINVADWEEREGGLQPVRAPKIWRDRWPARTAWRALSAAGVTLRFRTDSKKLVFRATFIDATDTPAAPAVAWERSRPSFFSLYRNGKYHAGIPALTIFTQQVVVIYNDANLSGDAEVKVLFPFYYRNAEIVMHAIAIEHGAKLSAAAPEHGPRVLFHGDSITHGHGVTSPRETYPWQVAEKIGCVPLNYGFGGTAWTDKIVAETIAARDDWDVLTIMLGANSLAGTDSAGDPETAAQYEKKYDDYLETIRTAAPKKPILCITPILNRLDLTGGNPNGEMPNAYRKAISRVVRRRQSSDENLHLLDGLSMVDDPLYLLVTDTVHPNDLGMHCIAEGVAAALKPIIENRFE